MSSVLSGGVARRESGAGAAAPGRPGPPRGTPSESPWQGTPTVIAGVGVLLLAMGVGVLIGRSGDSKPAPAPPQVISVASTPSAATPPPAASESSFTDDWPPGTSGFTVQLQALPRSSTTAAVAAAKTAARAKGAPQIGALKSEDFKGLGAGRYLIYSGVYHTRAAAQKALSRLKRSFPGATVITVSGGSSSAGGGANGAGGRPGGVGSSLSKPAPPSVLQRLSRKKGQSYEQESKNLPNVVSTG